jgi:uncharacterized protein (DUF58 family)
VTSLGLVLLKLGAIALPLLALAWAVRIYPRRPVIWLLLAPAAVTLGLLPAEFGAIAPAAANVVLLTVVALDGIAGAVLLADALTLPRKRSFSVERTAMRVASLRKPHGVTLLVTNHSRRMRRIAVRDGVPHELRPEPEQFDLRLDPRSRATLHYVLRPSRRGAFSIDRVHLSARSLLGFWQRLIDYSVPSSGRASVATAINVYPDMKQLGQYALLARTNRLSLMGVRRTRRIGQDHEFERLRDYTVDDNYKRIDWRATARRQKLIVRDYQATQSQRIVFLVDCGRMMTNEAAGLSLLDHALNAMLMMSYVALRQSDQVGLVLFSDDIHSYIPPGGGMRHMNRILHASFDRFPALVESRYDQAFRYLAAHCRKRSLVVLLTNVIDEVNANQVQQYLTNLVGRHLPLGVLMRDRRLFEAVEVEQPREDELWRAAAAAEILAWRHQVLTDLNSKGVLSLDVFPENLTAPLVNRYLEIKARHLL